MKIIFSTWRSSDGNDWGCKNQNGPMLQSSHSVRAESPCIKNQDKQLPLKHSLQIKLFPTCGAATPPHGTAQLCGLSLKTATDPMALLIFLHSPPCRIKATESCKGVANPTIEEEIF